MGGEPYFRGWEWGCGAWGLGFAEFAEFAGKAKLDADAELNRRTSGMSKKSGIRGGMGCGSSYLGPRGGLFPYIHRVPSAWVGRYPFPPMGMGCSAVQGVLLQHRRNANTANTCQYGYFAFAAQRINSPDFSLSGFLGFCFLVSGFWFLVSCFLLREFQFLDLSNPPPPPPLTPPHLTNQSQ